MKASKLFTHDRDTVAADNLVLAAGSLAALSIDRTYISPRKVRTKMIGIEAAVVLKQSPAYSTPDLEAER